MTPADTSALRRRLGRTWEAFFAPFGGSLRPVQHQAIPALLDGADVLIQAPTASGKTEAAAAPLVENLLGRQSPGVGIVYVCPTRALVNDLYRRLYTPLARLGVTLDRRTGDHGADVGRRPPQVLLTTPESLDSLLCRVPRALTGVQALVLDEIHLMEASARGDQLAILVERQRVLARSGAAGAGRPRAPLQVVALSATVGAPERLVERFLRRPHRVRIEGTRPLELELDEWVGPAHLGSRLARRVAGGQVRKILVFVNSRQDAEHLAGLVAPDLPFGDNVWAHHGSLSRRVREEVETGFHDARHGLVVATMTLELGIDMGDVDLVVLPSVPSDVS